MAVKFSKRHYEIIAKTLAQSLKDCKVSGYEWFLPGKVYQLNFIDIFCADNPLFNREMFQTYLNKEINKIIRD